MVKEKALHLETGDGHHEVDKSSGRGDRMRLLVMLFLTFTYFLVEIIVGYMTNSMALVADSFHMLSDVIALIIAYISVKMSPKAWSKNTFGWARAEVLGALVNAVFLVALCFSIVVESIERFIETKEILHSELLLIVGGVGLGVNLLGLALFHNHGHSHGGGHGHGHSHSSHPPSSHRDSNQHLHSHHNSQPQTPRPEPEDNSNLSIHVVGGWAVKGEVPAEVQPDEHNPDDHPHNVTANGKASKSGQNKGVNVKKVAPESKNGKKSEGSASQMNMHGVFLHVLADALGSVIVIISASIIRFTDWKYKNYVDPTLSIIMVILILCSVWPLLEQSAMVLLQTVPTHIQIDELKKRLLAKVPGAMEIHEFHIWQLAGNRIIASAHILCSRQTDYMGIGEQIKEFFHNEGIHSTTIQLEFPVEEGPEKEEGLGSDCFLTCPSDKDEDCISNTCCGVQQRKTASVRANLAFISESSPTNNISRNVT